MRNLDSDLFKFMDSDLPAVFRAADSAASSAQRCYLQLVVADLALVLGSATATSFAVSSQHDRAALAAVGAGCFLGGLVLTGLIIRTGYDRRWFHSRAVAESVKTIAWRYMACAEPYVATLTAAEADSTLCREIDSILRERRAIAGVLGGQEATGEQITEVMRRVRAAHWGIRRAVYLRERLQQQKAWYSDMARHNHERADRWLYAIAATQLTGAAAAIALVQWPNLLFNSAGVLAAVSAGFMAWLQLKRHQDLSSSYGLAVHELGLIEARARHVQNDADLSTLVSDAENAISREHTMWVARRDVVG